jgi:hypothetical protein
MSLIFVLNELLLGRSGRAICMMDSEIHTEIILGKTKGEIKLDKCTCRWNYAIIEMK